MSVVHALVGLICIAALVVAALAGASYSQNYDIGNRTDSFGNAPAAQVNQSGHTMAGASQGLASVSGGYLLFFAALFIVAIIIAAAAVMGKPKW